MSTVDYLIFLYGISPFLYARIFHCANMPIITLPTIIVAVKVPRERNAF